MNSALINGEEFFIYDSINVGIGVGLPDGIMSVVIKEAQDKNIFEISDELQEDIALLKAKKLPFDRMSGSTITLSNMGMGRLDYKMQRVSAVTTGQWNLMRGQKSMGFIDNPHNEPGVRVIAKPIGVINCICPTTNPIITIVGNGMECKRALVLFDKGVEAAGITEGIVQCVKDAGLEVVTCNMVEADPSDVSIDKITDFAKKEKIDGIVAVGGGATMDSGKILKKNLNESGPDMNVPLITVPTTSGTGAELTKAGVITDSKTGDKRGVGGYESMPDLALVDPELVLGVPARVTAA